MLFGGFIITFNRPQILKETILHLRRQTRPLDLLLIADNGNAEETRAVLAEIGETGIHHHIFGDNIGPAGAAAFSLRWLAEQGCDFIYWGDDDNPPQSPDILERSLSLLQAQNKPAGVGIAGTLWDWTKGKVAPIPDSDLKGIVDVDIVAGNKHLILSREIVDKVGVPCDKLFFCFEDFEYCLRIKQAGFRLLVDGDRWKANREKLGRLPLEKKTIRLPKQAYAATWRQYYSTRNYVFFMRNTFHRPDLARRELGRSLLRLCVCWLRGPKYGARFASHQIRGLVDGYRQKLGRTVQPNPKY